MATTSRGLPIFAQTDSADVAAKLNAISQTTNDYLVSMVDTPGASTSTPVAIKSGTFVVKFVNSPIVTVSVSFPVAFSQPPIIVCDVEPYTNNTPLDWGIIARTGSGFQIYVRNNTNGANLNGSVLGQFIAVGLA